MTSLALWILMAMMQQVGPDFQAMTFPETKMSVTLPCPVWANGIDVCEPLKRSNHREPMDVPAIQVKENLKHPWSRCWISNDPLEYIEPNGQLKFRLEWISEEEWNGTFKDMPKCGRTHWICADKSNVLWVAEDGRRWCHKIDNR